MRTALIFYQTGDSGALRSAVRCASRWNHGKIVVIGDDRYGTDTEFINVSELDGDFKYLDNEYKHKSPNPELFEKVCFYRWFAILAAIKKLGIEMAMCADTDCLIFCDPFSTKHHVGFDYTLSTDYEVNLKTAGMSFHSEKSLSAYKEFVLTKYFRSKDVEHYGSNDLGAWSAMAFDGEIYTELKRGETNTVIDGVIWDHHLGVTYGFVKAPDGGKLIGFHGGVPYAARSNGDAVMMAGLHCWSRFRTRIDHYVDIAEKSALWK